MKEVTEINLAALKAGGVFKQKEPGLFTIRVRVTGGRFVTEQLVALAQIARSYNLGHVHFTTRQGLEIPNVRFEDIEEVRGSLLSAGMEFSTGGPSIRTIVACQGGSCSHGLIDPQAMAMKIQERVGNRSRLPHKFKISISGCPNACTKPLENDLGIMGITLKTLVQDSCTQCGVCVDACRTADALDICDDRLVCREDTCVRCGDCIPACPFDAWESSVAYALFVGGRMGRAVRLADRLPLEVTGEENLLRVVERTIDWYAENGERRERFGSTLDRVGVEALVEWLSEK